MCLLVLGTGMGPARAQSAPPAISDDTLVVEPRDERAGDEEFEVRGAGFAPSSEVELVVSGSRQTATAEAEEILPMRLGTVTTDDAGRFDTTVRVGELPPDWYVMEARGENPDGSREIIARDLRIGTTEGGEDDLLDALQWVGYSLLLLGLLAVVIAGARKLDERRSGSAAP